MKTENMTDLLQKYANNQLSTTELSELKKKSWRVICLNYGKKKQEKL